MSNVNVFNILDRTGGGSAPAAYIVESSYSESSWYRVWSDGWIEQGGEIKLKQPNTVFITFPIPCSVPPKVFTEKTRHSFGDAHVGGVSQDTVETSRFRLQMDRWTDSGQGNTIQVFWRAEGY